MFLIYFPPNAISGAVLCEGTSENTSERLACVNK